MPNAILTAAIDALASGRDLSADQSTEVLATIMHGDASEVEIAGFLIALRTKGETVAELAGLARAMRQLAAHVPVQRDGLLDTAGTGGGRRTFNVSTTAALIAAGAGCAVAKHGNRSATSLSGSADLLEALGAQISLTPDAVARCIEDAGFGFMFAPAHHRATRFVVPVRRELAVRTVFNLLGPLTNPAGARRQLIGVSDPSALPTIAGALAQLGTERALVVAGADGIDEVSISAPTTVVEVNGEEIRSYTIDPPAVGVAPQLDGDDDDAPLRGGTPAQNAALTRAILDGAPGPATELAAINAGAAIYAAGATASIAEGVQAAREALAGGAAAEALERYVRASVRHAAPGGGATGGPVAASAAARNAVAGGGAPGGGATGGGPTGRAPGGASR
ncbi:MAG: anthranilate phosphoribosyltransferase [Solirubrobacterales bacterium]|nr:anthranilate phosphoribosyltransferase [Solirubrobacterales bacterium]